MIVLTALTQPSVDLGNWFLVFVLAQNSTRPWPAAAAADYQPIGSVV
jgi:hypothetical protein